MRKTNADLSDIAHMGGPVVDSDMYTVAQTLTQGQTFTTMTNAVNVATKGADSVTLMFKFTGANASSSGTVTFYIAVSYDGTNFETVGTPFAGTLNSNTAVAFAGLLDTRGVVAIECIKIVNGDASYGLTAVNIHAYSLQ